MGLQVKDCEVRSGMCNRGQRKAKERRHRMGSVKELQGTGQHGK